MAEPFLAEIRIFSFDFAPRGWAVCLGQLLPINQNQALFALLGTQYGGNGQINFALPNFGGRVAVGTSPSHFMGMQYGEQAHALTVQELPQHSHSLRGSDARATTTDPTQGVFANPFVSAPGRSMYGDSPNGSAASNAIGTAGQSQAHLNMQPYLTLLPCIALQGIFPSRD